MKSSPNKALATFIMMFIFMGVRVSPAPRSTPEAIKARARKG